MNLSEERKHFWENRYVTNQTGWDLNQISPPIKAYIDQIENKNLKILIPGAGNGHEAEYFFSKGFKNVFVLDIAKNPLDNFLKRTPYFPKSQLIYEDFFDHFGSYDLIIEQTFFCAIHPSLRTDYVNKMSELLVAYGKLVGLLFDFELTEKGPPFGGSKAEYFETFQSKFEIKTLERCYNSHVSRTGKEFFIIMKNNHEI